MLDIFISFSYCLLYYLCTIIEDFGAVEANCFGLAKPDYWQKLAGVPNDGYNRLNWLRNECKECMKLGS